VIAAASVAELGRWRRDSSAPGTSLAVLLLEHLRPGTLCQSQPGDTAPQVEPRCPGQWRQGTNVEEAAENDSGLGLAPMERAGGGGVRADAASGNDSVSHDTGATRSDAFASTSSDRPGHVLGAQGGALPSYPGLRGGGE
jgi:hypothetical protein